MNRNLIIVGTRTVIDKIHDSYIVITINNKPGAVIARPVAVGSSMYKFTVLKIYVVVFVLRAHSIFLRRICYQGNYLAVVGNLFYHGNRNTKRITHQNSFSGLKFSDVTYRSYRSIRRNKVSTYFIPTRKFFRCGSV